LGLPTARRARELRVDLALLVRAGEAVAEKILGIDLGSTAIKVVQVSRTLKMAQVTGCARARVPVNSDLGQVAQLLKELIDHRGLESDRYLLAVGTDEAFIRRTSFPFTSDRKIAQVIRFDLESDLPVAVEELAVDFMKREQLASGQQGVLAAAISKRVLTPLLAALREQGIEPTTVDLDGGALGAVAQELRGQAPERLVVLDIGQRKTTFMYWQNGRPAYLRALMGGCARLARVTADSLGVSPEQGLERLFAVGVGGAAKGPDATAAFLAITKEIEALAREIELSLLAAQVEEHQEKAELVVLTGGGSLIGGLAPALEQALGLPVRSLADLQPGGVLGQIGEAAKDAPVYAVAGGLVLGRLTHRGGFNFRREGTTALNFFVKWRREVTYAAVAVTLLAVTWLASVGLDTFMKKRRLVSLERNIETVFHRALPDVKGRLQPAQYVSALKARVKELGQAATFLSQREQHSAVELLRNVSAAVPKNLDVSVTLLTMEGPQVRLSGKADAFNTVDSLKSALAESQQFAKVTITDAKAAADGKGVQYSMDLERKAAP
jgi:type IV pilus assembly protein PilM